MTRVLLVDEHHDLREAMPTTMQSMGFAVITAKNGKEGVETAITEKPGLILMDFMMPEMDGWEASRKS